MAIKKIKHEFDLENNQVLTISTWRISPPYLKTTATVAAKNGSFLTHKMYEDYSKTWAHSAPSRLTDKVLKEQHNSVIEKLEEIKEDFRLFYSGKSNG